MSFMQHERVLVFSAHAADFCSRAGGTIARFVDAGTAVHIHDLSFGERCEAPALYALDPTPSLDEIKPFASGRSKQRRAFWEPPSTASISAIVRC